MRALLAIGGSLLALACGPTDSAPESNAPADTTPRLLLLVTVDTLRADHLGAYGSDRELTPHLDALAGESLVFERVYAPTPFTVPSLVTLHTGRYPSELGMKSNLSEIPDEIPTLAEALRAGGWRTGAVVSNVVLQSRPDLARGFDVFDDTMQQVESVRQWPERIAADTTDAALEVLEAWHVAASESQEPLFLWVHYQDPHGPYTPPPGLRERYEALERERAGDRELPRDESPFGRGGIPVYQQLGDAQEVAHYRAAYDAEIAYMDQELGRLLDALPRYTDAPRIRTVFAADHGEAMGEHDFWFAHGHHLTDELLRVPLLLRGPDLAPGRRADTASLADLVPTLTRWLGEAPLDSHSVGRDLLAADAASHASVPLLSTLAAYPDPRWGIVSDDYKLILTLDGDIWSAELYRLGNEEVNLAAPAAAVATRLRQQLKALRERYDRGAPERSTPLTEARRAQLEALGYLHEPAP
jgi:arylsulfatase